LSLSINDIRLSQSFRSSAIRFSLVKTTPSYCIHNVRKGLRWQFELEYDR